MCSASTSSCAKFRSPRRWCVTPCGSRRRRARIRRTRPDFVNEWVSWGAGTRAGQFLILGAKARALLRGRAHVTVEDIQALAIPALRHRILLNYRAEAEGIKIDEVVKRLVAADQSSGQGNGGGGGG